MGGQGRDRDCRAPGARGARAARRTRTSRSYRGTRLSARAHLLLAAYDRLLEGLDRVFQYHFELLNLGYGAYLALLRALPEGVFPDIEDRTLARMVAGIDVLVALRPDDELRRLAAQAVELGIGDARARRPQRERICGPRSPGAKPGAGGWPTSRRRRIPGSTSPAGPAPSTTITARGSTTRRSRSRRSAPTSGGSRPARTSRDRTRAIVAERERITAEHRELVSPRSSAPPSTSSLALTRTVFPYVENHNFYVDHRYLTIFWNKVREFGALLARHGFLVDEARTSSSCATTRSARRSRISGSPGAGGAAAASGRCTGRRSSSAASRSMTAMRGGRRRSRSAGARGDHRADHDHALGHHDRTHPGVAESSEDGRSSTLTGSRGLTGGRRGCRPCDPRRVTNAA